MPEDLREILNFLPQEKEELKALPYVYQSVLSETRKELIKSLYELKEKLHPEFLFTTGERGSMNDINWLLEHKDEFKEKKENYLECIYRLRNLSTGFAEMLFGEFADQPFDSELVYQISASTFRKMGLRSYVKFGEEKFLQVDLTPLGKGIVTYKFVPWTSGIEKSVGKVLDEYYLENEHRVEIGLKPSVFRSLSSGITTPVHEIIHHISNLYNSEALSSAVLKSFNSAFKEIPSFQLLQDRGMLFGSVDNKLREELKKNNIDLRGKDVLNPFILWEIVKRHGIKISEISKIPLHKLYDATYRYLSTYLPFRLLEEGIASYLPIKNASIEEIPKDLKGLNNSLTSLVKFGARLRKLEYFERGIEFYTGENQLGNYYQTELQLYPLAYLYIDSQVNLKKPQNIKWYFDLVRENYLKRGIRISSSRYIKRKRIEEVSPRVARERRIQAMINQMKQNIQEYKQKLDEVDTLLKEYKRQLDDAQSFRFSSFSHPTPNLHNVLDNPRIRNAISKEMRNNELFRNVMYVAAGAIIIYGLTTALDRYF